MKICTKNILEYVKQQDKNSKNAKKQKRPYKNVTVIYTK